MEDYQKYLTKVKGYADRTVTSYLDNVSKFLSKYDHRSVTKNDVHKYLKEINGNDMKNSTIASLKSFFAFAVKEGELKNNPMATISSVKTQRKATIPITEKEMEAILAPDNFRTKEDYILFETLYLTGMRIDELHSLPSSRINKDQNAIVISGKGDKDRMIYLPDYAIENLLSIVKGDKICSYTYHTLRSKIAFYLKDFKKAKLTSTTQTSSHCVRKSFATHLHNSGAGILTIKNALGHSSVATTAIYTHLDMEFLKAQHRKLQRNNF